jgi:hypothetical protein
MHDVYVTDLCELLRRRGWRVHHAPAPRAAIPSFLDAFLPARSFAAKVRSCVAPGEKARFLGLSDYLDDSPYGWSFLQQQISLPSTEGDAAWRREVEEFWSAHLPVALRVVDGYSYIAVDRDGAFYLGEAPELELPEVVARSPGKFLARLAAEVAEETGPLHAFVGEAVR